ncbi:MAG: hypothetical protein HYT87_14835 [Nitrospirae bacterium]|nr:hypothetical protein [Nitrospirota bacterium]
MRTNLGSLLVALRGGKAAGEMKPHGVSAPKPARKSAGRFFEVWGEAETRYEHMRGLTILSLLVALAAVGLAAVRKDRVYVVPGAAGVTRLGDESAGPAYAVDVARSFLTQYASYRPETIEGNVRSARTYLEEHLLEPFDKATIRQVERAKSLSLSQHFWIRQETVEPTGKDYKVVLVVWQELWSPRGKEWAGTYRYEISLKKVPVAGRDFRGLAIVNIAQRQEAA